MNDDKTLYIYIDESGTPNFSDNDPFIIGAIITTTPFPNDLFAESFLELSKDPEFNEYDQKTTDRNYYHASADSKNAHSYCCRTIAKIKENIEFHFIVFFKDKMNQAAADELKMESVFHQHLVSLIAVSSTISQFKKLSLFVAERKGSFTGSTSDIWERQFVDAISDSIVNRPYIPAIIPQIKINIVGPDNVGVQVCDFVLWAAQRNILQNNEDWIKRSRFKKTMHYKTENDSQYVEIRELNGPAANNLILPIEKTSKIRKEYSQNDIYNAMVAVERHLDWLIANRDRISNEIVLGKFDAVMFKAKDEMGNDDIIEMAEVYLLVSDDIPLYDPSKQEEIDFVYFNKQICSMVADKTDIGWITRTSQWRQLRNHLLLSEPSKLKHKNL